MNLQARSSMSILLHKFVIDCKASLPASDADTEIMSFMCCGLRPSIPLAEPFKNESIAFLTFFVETVKDFVIFWGFLERSNLWTVLDVSSSVRSKYFRLRSLIYR